jgi:hypothetical protein
MQEPLKPDWILKSADQRWAFTTPSYNYPGGMPSKVYRHDVDTHHQLRNPRVTSEHINGFPFSDLNSYPNLPKAQPYITNDGTRIEIVVRNWGPSFAFWLWADIYYWDFGNPQNFQESQDLYYGQVLQFTVPKECTSWRIQGTTRDGSAIDLATSSVHSPYLEHLTDVVQDDRRVISYEVKVPEQLRM